jgi:hypothetical protein
MKIANLAEICVMNARWVPEYGAYLVPELNLDKLAQEMEKEKLVRRSYPYEDT